ncbi:MAG: carbon-nitrogen hydrolase family protein [Pirellulales bacterium]
MIFAIPRVPVLSQVKHHIALLPIFVGCSLLFAQEVVAADDSARSDHRTMRIAAAQPKNRTIDWKIDDPAEVLRLVDRSLGELAQLIRKAGEANCDAVAFPEDTLGLLKWEVTHRDSLDKVLPVAVERMLDRLGRAAAQENMYVVVCNDTIAADGATHNTSFLLGRDGKEIGRYQKVNLPLVEMSNKRGQEFPVYSTPDLGAVGMLICYDMIFPEAARCLALQGADVIFHPTLGGAAIGDEDISLAAFRTRAVENFVYLIVSMRGSGSMIISPQGKVLATASEPDELAIADIDPFGGREGGDAFNRQLDMRGRLFRERVPQAYSILTDPEPPVLAKVPSNVTADEAVRIAALALTTGEERFKQAESLARAGKTAGAIESFEKLCAECRTSWIERAARQRIETLVAVATKDDPPSTDAVGIAAKYASDVGIEKDPRVVFVENFEEESLDSIEKRWETVTQPETMTLESDVPPGSGGKRSLLMAHVGGKGTGGHLYRRLQPGYEKLHGRFYVKFDPDCMPIHHFGTTLGGNHPATPWPSVRAGQPPAGDKSFWVGIEPFGKNWVWDYYTYWNEMRGSPPRGQTWGNSFVRDPELKVERGKWICVELMMKMNDPDDTNGEMAFWLDGKRISHLGKGFPKGKWVYDKFNPGDDGEGIRWNREKGGPERFMVPKGGAPFEGFRWRTADDLKLNYVWLYLYITQAPAGHVSRVWFDDVVIATEYIGPIKKPE